MTQLSIIKKIIWNTYNMLSIIKKMIWNTYNMCLNLFCGGTCSKSRKKMPAHLHLHVSSKRLTKRLIVKTSLYPLRLLETFL